MRSGPWLRYTTFSSFAQPSLLGHKCRCARSFLFDWKASCQCMRPKDSRNPLLSASLSPLWSSRSRFCFLVTSVLSSDDRVEPCWPNFPSFAPCIFQCEFAISRASRMLHPAAARRSVRCDAEFGAGQPIDQWRELLAPSGNHGRGGFTVVSRVVYCSSRQFVVVRGSFAVVSR